VSTQTSPRGLSALVHSGTGSRCLSPGTLRERAAASRYAPWALNVEPSVLLLMRPSSPCWKGRGPHRRPAVSIRYISYNTNTYGLQSNHFCAGVMRAWRGLGAAASSLISSWSGRRGAGSSEVRAGALDFGVFIGCTPFGPGSGRRQPRRGHSCLTTRPPCRTIPVMSRNGRKRGGYGRAASIA
jgi:hypothetical protein